MSIFPNLSVMNHFIKILKHVEITELHFKTSSPSFSNPQTWQQYQHDGVCWCTSNEKNPKHLQCRSSSEVCMWGQDQAPVPLSIFRSNSKFDENAERSSFKYTQPITTIFCARHDSDTVVTCAKYRCDRPRIFYTRVFWIFIEFRIRSKYA